MPEDFADCAHCTLSREFHVPPYGNADHPLGALIGEAPGKWEVTRQRPFAGRAGDRLRIALAQAGVEEASLYITNTCSCRPPKNRKPRATEVRACWPRFEREINEVQPGILICLGGTSGKRLIPEFTNVTDTRGKILDSVLGYKAILTFHPAATLYPGGQWKLPYLIQDLVRAIEFAKGLHPKD